MTNKTTFETINIDDFNHEPINQSKVQSYPPELVGRFNSFIVTAFDDSMTVEMQIRTLIKWIKENIDVTTNALDNMEAFKLDSMAFQNHVKNTLVNLINQFTDQFDDNLKAETLAILTKWFNDGVLSDIVRNAINEEVINARGDKENLGQRLDEADIKLAQNTNKSESVYINVKYPPHPYVGAVGDGVTDDTIAIKSIIADMDHGQVLYFPDGVYLLSETLYLNKSIELRGSKFGWNSTRLIFNNCSGIIIANNAAYLTNITLEGRGKNQHSVNIEERNFGNIGIKLQYGNGRTSNNTHCNNVWVSQFNIGLTIYAEPDETWSGCYREFTNFYVDGNHIGVVALDGATYEKFYGGVISNNSLYGVYSESDNIYANSLEFIGTSIEKNGTWDFGKNLYTEGVYSGRYSQIRISHGYLENQRHYAAEGGKIIINSSYINVGDVDFYGNGSIVINNSLSSYEHRKTYRQNLAGSLPWASETIKVTDVSDKSPHIRVTSNQSGYNALKFPTVRLGNLPAKDIKAVKFSATFKINRGIYAENFGIRPIIRVTGENSSSVGGEASTVRLYPPTFSLDKKLGVLQNYEVYYSPTIRDGHLSATDIIKSVVVDLVFTQSQTSFNTDYSVDNLDIEIINPVITVYSNYDLGEPDIPLTTDLKILTTKNLARGDIFYQNNDLGMVQIFGKNVRPSTIGDGTVITTLPPRYKPKHEIVITCYNEYTGVEAFLKLMTNGDIVLTAGGSITLNSSLNFHVTYLL